MNRTSLVISDVHLAPTRDARESYRRPEYGCDASLARLLNDAGLAVSPDRLELVLAGDVFDFDSADSTRIDAAAAELAKSILRDHPHLVDTVARLGSRGARIVVIPGNHDAQVSLPSVQKVILDNIKGVVFRRWFHRAGSGRVHIEHGHQYDPPCSVSSMIPRGGSVEITLGSVVSYHAPRIMQDYNPHSADPFIALAALESPSPKIDRDRIASLLGSLSEAGSSPPMEPMDRSRFVDDVASETSASSELVQSHLDCLVARPMRLAEFISERLWRNYGSSVRSWLACASSRIAAIHGVSAVVMGHAHAPEVIDFENPRVRYVNTGSWAPTAGLPYHEASRANTFAWVLPSGDVSLLRWDGSRATRIR